MADDTGNGDPGHRADEAVARPAPVPPVRIDDPGDPRLGDYAALTDAALRKRYEHQHGVLIAEGPNPVRALVSSPYPLRSVLVAEERLPAMADVVDRSPAPVYVVTRAVLEAVVRFRLHQGVLACGERRPPAAPEDVVATARQLLLLEGLNDHENLGTLFRTARGLGIDGVLLAPGCADPLYRRCVRVSMGHVLHLPFARVSATAAGLELLHGHGVTTVALTPDPSAPPLEELSLAGDRLAVLLGAEGPGLSDAALRGATLTARIAMAAEVDSLNVAAAGAIACHALTRRR
ncbi:MAG: RNA methyltransferase [Nitriliruptoraceae bacterium]